MFATDERSKSPNDAFDQYESDVRYYCRSFPDIFVEAHNATLKAEEGREYIDFFAAAGSLNYGHNDGQMKSRLIEYIAADGILQALDMFTVAKREFIVQFQELVLKPRGLNYKMQFCGPTGANAVEAALKLSRLVTGRSGVVAFSGGFHGLSLGSLSVSGSKKLRAFAGTRLDGCTFVPFAVGPRGEFPSVDLLSDLFDDPQSGVEVPAAVIVEAVQAEGGVYEASDAWLASLSMLCKQHEIILILDEIQTGCGRTGDFFAFERSRVKPDIICLSKSISGIGLPMAMLLIRPEIDKWKPGAHTGTFRGNQLAFVTASSALEFWRVPGAFESSIRFKSEILEEGLRAIATDENLLVRGRGMLWGLDFGALGAARASRASQLAFVGGLIVETAGRNGSTLKLTPPLTTESDLLRQGLRVLATAVRDSNS